MLHDCQVALLVTPVLSLVIPIWKEEHGSGQKVFKEEVILLKPKRNWEALWSESRENLNSSPGVLITKAS